MMLNARKVLIIDNDVEFIQRVQLKFENLNFDVQVTATSNSLFNLINTFKPDIILLNREYGPESIFRELRNNPTTAGIKIIQYIHRPDDEKLINIPERPVFEFNFSDN